MRNRLVLLTILLLNIQSFYWVDAANGTSQQPKQPTKPQPTAQPNPKPKPTPPPKDFDYPESLEFLDNNMRVEFGSTHIRRQTFAAFYVLPSTDFQVVAWPVEICQGVYVCPAQTKDRLIDPVDFSQADFCTQDGSIHFFPADHKLIIYQGSNRIVKAWDLPWLNFEATATDGTYNLMTLDAYDYDAYLTTKKPEVKPVTVKMANKDLLVLSNSRYCHPTVSQPSNGGRAEFLPNLNTVKNPAVLVNQGKEVLDYRLALGNVRNYENLPLIVKQTALMKLNKKGRCPKVFYDTRGTSGITSTWKIPESKDLALWQYEIVEIKDCIDKQLPKSRFLSVNIAFDDCEWVRVWLTDKKDDIKFDSKKHLKSSIDLLVGQGLLIPSDSDVARPLAVAPGALSSVRLRITEGYGDNIVEVSYGWLKHDENNFRETMSLAGASTYRPYYINLIKPANCGAAVLNDMMHDALYQGVSAAERQCHVVKSCRQFDV
ncbi:unnamed protein product [Caenorhabditis auriculariae]|uniref:Uncharacterized protein n=1 Tax=Caenorhabditis auriculariae TaxID=2777116 RepID=A0A8S1HPD5_9PELO|nr:unnamed protein product [Caenorhabditis auriculariae]